MQKGLITWQVLDQKLAVASVESIVQKGLIIWQVLDTEKLAVARVESIVQNGLSSDLTVTSARQETHLLHVWSLLYRRRCQRWQVLEKEAGVLKNAGTKSVWANRPKVKLDKQRNHSAEMCFRREGLSRPTVLLWRVKLLKGALWFPHLLLAHWKTD